MSFFNRPHVRVFGIAASFFFLAFSLIVSQALADTNLVTSTTWVVDGTDDTGPSPTNITMSVKNHAVGSFSELAVSYNVGGSGVVAVCTITGAGEIRITPPPPSEFGGSYFLTGYWDCDNGFVPAMMFTQLDIRFKGGKNGYLQLKGKLSNGTSMASKDFQFKLYAPQPDLVYADVRYSLTATRDFCVDQTVHTNAENFPVLRMAGNYLSDTNQTVDKIRYLKVVSRTCVLGHCVTKKASYCEDLVNPEEFVFDGGTRIGDPMISLAHTLAAVGAPTLGARILKPAHSQVRIQGSVAASSDPVAENVNFWPNWTGVKDSYRAGKKVEKFQYRLRIVPAGAVSCNHEE